MKKHTTIKTFLSTLVLFPSLFFSLNLYAQLPAPLIPAAQTFTTDSTMIVKGGTFYVNTGGLVKVNGTFINQDPTPLVNNNLPAMAVRSSGQLIINGDFLNNFECGRDAIFVGGVLIGSFENDGEIYVAGDWINNDTFWSGIGSVFLNAAPNFPNAGNQLITGVLPTTFNTLVLDTFGVKSMTLNAFVKNTLNIKNSELRTNLHNMYVLNSIPGCVQNITGFVSTSSNADNSVYGRLHRLTTDSNADYFFPMGDSLTSTTFRYRPAIINPTNNDTNTFAVSFFNESPSNYGYNPTLVDDSTICSVNPNYFYNITRENGIADADITLTYDALIDGNLSGIVNWRTFPAPTQWKNTGGPFPTNNIGALVGVKKTDNFDWNFRRFNLGNVRPNKPVISGPSSFCGEFDAQYSFTPTPGTTYDWDLQMGNVIGDTTVNPVTVQWQDTTASFAPGTGIIKLVETLNGCPSLPGFYTVSILSNPIAGFNVVTPYTNGTLNPNLGDSTQIFTLDMLQMENTSQNSVSWYWDFANTPITNTSILESPFQYYDDIGNYNVMLVATSGDGCVDTAFSTVSVVEGSTEVPNVFTPNNDGVNDVLILRNSNVSEYNLKVYNRWGVLVFETSAPQIKWDGNTISGQPASGGTYFWILDVKFKSGTEWTGEKKGYVELVRN